MPVLFFITKKSLVLLCWHYANVFREKGCVEIQAIGAGALNQAIKAIAIARGFVAPSGKNLICIPAFTDITIDGEEKTAIKLIVEAK